MAQKIQLVRTLIKWINSLFAILLLLAYAIPYLEPKTIGILSVLSSFTPVLIILNAIFVIYWLIQLKKEFMISLLVLIAGFSQVKKLYNYNDTEATTSEEYLSIMSYNVRGFNIYKWIKQSNVPFEISNFINKKQVDIVCFQEYYNDKKLALNKYKYHYIKGSSKTEKFGQAIYSKYQIINSGSLNFDSTANNAIFVDIIKAKDTIRIYNIHLQSLKIYNLAKNVSSNKEKIATRISETNKQQQEQVAQILKHKKQCSYKTILCGDFNNTAFSYSYQALSKGMQDAFVAKGKGFGKTFGAFYFPFRIDFMLADSKIKIAEFETSSINYSDHKPIIAKVAL